MLADVTAGKPAVLMYTLAPSDVINSGGTILLFALYVTIISFSFGSFVTSTTLVAVALLVPLYAVAPVSVAILCS